MVFAQLDRSLADDNGNARRYLRSSSSGGSGGANGTTALSSRRAVCHDPHSFLGVGNIACVQDNLSTSVFLLALIIVVSIVFERVIHFIRRGIRCPQLRKIVNRIFEEVMVMGFISMIIFTCNTSGLLKKLNFTFNGLTATEQLHFYEFFHYIVFLTMIYFILIVLFLLFVGTVMPKIIWKIKQEQDVSDEEDEGDYDFDNAMTERDTHPTSDERVRQDTLSSVRPPYRSSTLRRGESGMDLVNGSRAYSLLLQRYQREGWCFRFNLVRQWHLWKSFEILAYNICQNRSGYLYKNPLEMERIFGVKPQRDERGVVSPAAQLTYERYHELCMRNLLFNITHLHFSAFFILLAICILPVMNPGYDHWIFIGVGSFLLMVNIAIFLKVGAILRGIVDDRLRVITTREIEMRLRATGRVRPLRPMGKHRPSLKALALGVRAIIRMQMSALCHRQLHYHDDRFWFNSPKFLLRMFQFATIGQAFYLVWLSLVQVESIVHYQHGWYILLIMVLLPFLALFVITPMTMPSLVLIMGLTGVFVELNGDSEGLAPSLKPAQAQARIRFMRRSFLKSYYTDNDEIQPPPLTSPVCLVDSMEAPPTPSPSNVYLRMYDSPTRPSASDCPSPVNSRRSFISDTEDSSAQSSARGRSKSAIVGGGTLPATRASTIHHPRADGVNSDNRRSFSLASFAAAGNAAMMPPSMYDWPYYRTLASQHQPAAAGAAASESIGDRIANEEFLPRTAQTTATQATTALLVTTASCAESVRSLSRHNSLDANNPTTPTLSGYCSKYGGYPEY
ncbi:TPA: hypothetical protein N0F65_009746 [Lagenidium giganteum]|uniref:MLO-like protein n=1 Tax=Lagenidium giganteum TaxID=4803 RepID=A0AAV2YLZ6_9STRA|nr:TPA: hypothetical protein N0F65_009746 [Lagenidium giganteum]